MKGNRYLMIGVAFIAAGILGQLALNGFCSRGGMVPGMTGGMCGMMRRMPRTGMDPAALPEPGSQAAQTYAHFCSQCHPPQSPKRFSARAWEALVERMDGRMRKMYGMRGGGMMKNMPMMGRMRDVRIMSRKEKGLILSYLKRHALPVIPEDRLRELDSPGAEIFKRVCSQCHDLPDPGSHKQDEWGIVVERMKENMEEMNTPIMKEREEKQILAFLTGKSTTPRKARGDDRGMGY